MVSTAILIALHVPKLILLRLPIAHLVIAEVITGLYPTINALNKNIDPMQIQVAEPDRNTFLLEKLEEMWRNHPCCFVLALIVVVAIIVGIIFVVVFFVVTPSLPTARVKKDYAQYLKDSGQGG